MFFNKQNILYSLSVIFFLIGLFSCSNELRDINGNLKEKDIIKTNGTIDFNKEKWETSSSETRGKMIRSLFLKHKFIGKQNKYIDELLGNHTCYIDYEDQPCYELIYNGDYYFLVFYAKHSGNVGEITDIKFFARD